jgi:hypothetical protein
MIPEQFYPFRGEAKQTLKDQQLVAEEVAEVGPAFQVMAHRLRSYSKQTLANIAIELARQIQSTSTSTSTTTFPTPTPKLPRLAPRYRAAMICWFCKWAPDFPGQVQVQVQGPFQHQSGPWSAQPPAPPPASTPAQVPVQVPAQVPAPVAAPAQDGHRQDGQIQEDARIDEWEDYDWGSEFGY